jgi:hypothetical protein
MWWWFLVDFYKNDSRHREFYGLTPGHACICAFSTMIFTSQSIPSHRQSLPSASRYPNKQPLPYYSCRDSLFRYVGLMWFGR